MPLVTCVCLTTWPKRKAFLPDALRSFRQQTLPSREMVVVNDGTPLVSHVPDVRVVNLQPIGRKWTIGEKRNVGVRAAQGTYLATWDDDDVSLPNRLADQANAVILRRADGVLAGKMAVADEEMHLLGDCNRGPKRPVQPSAMLRRSAVIACGGYPAADYLEDAQVIERIRLLLRGLIIVMPGSNFYVLRRHGSNVTLGAGESNQAYANCAARSPDVVAMQRRVDALRAGPGGEDVTE